MLALLQSRINLFYIAKILVALRNIINGFSFIRNRIWQVKEGLLDLLLSFLTFNGVAEIPTKTKPTLLSFPKLNQPPNFETPVSEHLRPILSQVTRHKFCDQTRVPVIGILLYIQSLGKQSYSADWDLMGR